MTEQASPNVKSMLTDYETHQSESHHQHRPPNVEYSISNVSSPNNTRASEEGPVPSRLIESHDSSTERDDHTKGTNELIKELSDVPCTKQEDLDQPCVEDVNSNKEDGILIGFVKLKLSKGNNSLKDVKENAVQERSLSTVTNRKSAKQVRLPSTRKVKKGEIRNSCLSLAQSPNEKELEEQQLPTSDKSSMSIIVDTTRDVEVTSSQKIGHVVTTSIPSYSIRTGFKKEKESSIVSSSKERSVEINLDITRTMRMEDVTTSDEEKVAKGMEYDLQKNVKKRKKYKTENTVRKRAKCGVEKSAHVKAHATLNNPLAVVKYSVKGDTTHNVNLSQSSEEKEPAPVYYYCPVCAWEVGTLNTVKTHLSKKHGITRLDCPVEDCLEKGIQSWEEMQLHFMEIHEGYPERYSALKAAGPRYKQQWISKARIKNRGKEKSKVQIDAKTGKRIYKPKPAEEELRRNMKQAHEYMNKFLLPTTSAQVAIKIAEEKHLPVPINSSLSVPSAVLDVVQKSNMKMIKWKGTQEPVRVHSVQNTNPSPIGSPVQSGEVAVFKKQQPTSSAIDMSARGTSCLDFFDEDEESTSFVQKEEGHTKAISTFSLPEERNYNAPVPASTFLTHVLNNGFLEESDEVYPLTKHFYSSEQPVYSIELNDIHTRSNFVGFVHFCYKTGMTKTGATVLKYNISARDQLIMERKRLRLLEYKIVLIDQQRFVRKGASGFTYLILIDNGWKKNANKLTVGNFRDEYKSTTFNKNASPDDVVESFLNSIEQLDVVYASGINASLFPRNTGIVNLRNLRTDLNDKTMFYFKVQGVKHWCVDFYGITSPMLYIGMKFTLFGLHKEDYNFGSVSFLHYGAMKTWFIIGAQHAQKLEKLIQKEFPGVFACNAALRHKNIFVHPKYFKQYDIPYVVIHQVVGTAVVLFPGCYHQGFNHDFNISESVNWQTADGFPETMADDYVCFCKPKRNFIPRDGFVSKYAPDMLDVFRAGQFCITRDHCPDEKIPSIGDQQHEKWYRDMQNKSTNGDNKLRQKINAQIAKDNEYKEYLNECKMDDEEETRKDPEEKKTPDSNGILHPDVFNTFSEDDDSTDEEDNNLFIPLLKMSERAKSLRKQTRRERKARATSSPAVKKNVRKNSKSTNHRSKKSKK